ncbi:expressed unknown protein [Ectocarpus siliculosus]|uniref:Uncharacterized protein n=1 Tax=Ectocarpus siliculosus TaxID=2880 RepID=D8LQS6_ECTSI|nr:expressed unknown protein [Ectocarpus siliculosus]|eukprot:CBN74953.1 expressed unknown protein [Ectocarpus siliculosus]
MTREDPSRAKYSTPPHHNHNRSHSPGRDRQRSRRDRSNRANSDISRSSDNSTVASEDRCLATATAAAAAALRTQTHTSGQLQKPKKPVRVSQRKLQKLLRDGGTGSDALKGFLQGVARHFDGSTQSDSFEKFGICSP